MIAMTSNGLCTIGPFFLSGTVMPALFGVVDG